MPSENTVLFLFKATYKIVDSAMHLVRYERRACGKQIKLMNQTLNIHIKNHLEEVSSKKMKS